MKLRLNKILVTEAVLTLALVIFGVFFLTGSSNSAQAAEMFFVTSTAKSSEGILSVDLLLNTEEANLNTVAGKVNFPVGLLKLEEIKDGNSVVNLWVDKPEVNSNGQIMFSGVTPGGYKGRSGLLFSLIFSVLKSGLAKIWLSQGQALLNDGKGTAVSLSAPAYVFQTTAKINNQPTIYSNADKTPPQRPVSEIAQQSDTQANKWFIVFRSQDKESGIDHYEMQESLQNNSDSGNWRIVSSPYVLQDQTLNSYIFIKAVDKAGNSAITVLRPRNVRLDYNQIVMLFVIFAVVVFFTILLYSKLSKEKRIKL